MVIGLIQGHSRLGEGEWIPGPFEIKISSRSTSRLVILNGCNDAVCLACGPCNDTECLACHPWILQLAYDVFNGLSQLLLAFYRHRAEGTLGVWWVELASTLSISSNCPPAQKAWWCPPQGFPELMVSWLQPPQIITVLLASTNMDLYS